MKRTFVISVLIILSVTCLYAQTIWLDDLDLSSMEIGWGVPHA